MAENNNQPLYYSDYLQLERLLGSQSPKSAEHGRPAHDETLFIIVHQVFELWFKQILHELDSVLALFKGDYVDEKQISVVVSRLLRVSEIQKLINEQFRIIETMTPLDFLEFRGLLAPASGFQSVQFRLIENKLGLRPERRMMFDKNAYTTHVSPEHEKVILQSETEPSLLQLIERWLERTPFLDFNGFNFWLSYRQAVTRMLQFEREKIAGNPAIFAEEKHRLEESLAANVESFNALFDEASHRQLTDKGKRQLSYKAMQAALLIQLYRDEPILHLPYRLLTALVEIDELFTTWRYKHALMVHRMIGNKTGTGGSAGYHYLKATVDKHKLFADLFNLSTFLIPRSELPELPDEIRRNLGFYYSAK